ncbi:Protein ccc1 [Vermiconidia calcicola]|uniref:Protein ccc1 n=1 Tax=Vermiconidia calcicola TaxID=1690605 RepID=A0ACC3N5W7_9PEZI|nr:Protein ccc1 [Vermiconidia calcicola]
MGHSKVSIHKEHHSVHGDLVRDSIIGFSDGLTVPFALTAGLSSLGSSKIVILGGMAELFAGSISMGVGAFLASMTDRKHYEVEEAREWREVKESPREEEEEIYEIFEKYGIQRNEAKGVVDGLKANEEVWVQFMMDFELRLSKPSQRHAFVEGLVMGVSYFVGGLLPLIPYFILVDDVTRALFVSIPITGVVLLAFGYTKAKLTGTGFKDAAISALQTLALGGLAAGTAYGVVEAVNSNSNFGGAG